MWRSVMILPVYYDCRKWEDWQNGMYRTVSENQDLYLVSLSIELLSNKLTCSCQMRRVITEWPICSEENLSKVGTNRRAWLGWAACSIHHNAPDFCTRKAWGRLTDSDRIDANDCADTVIREWEASYTPKYLGCQCIQLSLWG